MGDFGEENVKALSIMLNLNSWSLAGSLPNLAYLPIDQTIVSHYKNAQIKEKTVF